MPLPQDLKCLVRVETRFLRRKRFSQLYLQFNGSKAQLCYSGHNCKNIPSSLNKMFGDKVECLDLSYNSLVSLRGLNGFPALRDLVLDNNKLTEINPLPFMQNLTALSLNNNLITNLDTTLIYVLNHFPNLTYLSLLGNPACPDQLSDRENDDADYQRYRYYVIYKIRSLKFLDSKRISDDERMEALRRGQFLRVRKPDYFAPLSSATTNNNPSPYTALPVISSKPEHRVDVVVEHDYTAVEDNELSIRRGEIIRNVEQKQGGWWRGELRGRFGLFPDNFVCILATQNSNEVILRNTPRYCRALFSYQQANVDELNLTVGDIIQVLGEVEEGWWRGQRENDCGVFPSNFVLALETTPPLPPKPVREQCRVVFPYTAANVDELTLVEGDILTIISKDVPDQGWWRGELRGRTGLFPDNFVTMLPTQSGGDTANKKPLRPIKKLPSINQPKNHSLSSNKKDSRTSENIAAVRKSLESHDFNALETASQKSRKSIESIDSNSDNSSIKSRRSHDTEVISEPAKSRRSLDVDNSGVGKPPIPVKKASSPVAAMFSGLKQKVFSSGQSSTDTSDGIGSSKPSGEPILTSISPSPSPIPPVGSGSPYLSDQTMSESFDQVERSSMLNDPRSGRVKGPPRRPPTQAARDDAPLTNGSSHLNSSTESTSETEIRPKTREWEKRKTPWLEELKQNQAKKTTPIGDIGRSKTVSASDSMPPSDKPDPPPSRLSSSSDKLLENTESEPVKDLPPINPLEMSQSMTSISSRAIKIDTTTEAHIPVENPLDMSKSLSSISTRSTHVETNSKVSPSELRTSISSTANVILRSTAHMPGSPPTNQMPTINAYHLSVSKSLPQTTFDTKGSNQLSNISINFNDTNEKDVINPPIAANGVSHPEATPDQLLISQLNERVANLERVVETQESRFTSMLASLNERLTREIELRKSLQADIQKLERCVTRV